MKKFILFVMIVLTICLIGCTKGGEAKSSIPPLTPPLSYASTIQSATNVISSTEQATLPSTQTNTFGEVSNTSQGISNSVEEKPAPSSNATSTWEESSKTTQATTNSEVVATAPSSQTTALTSSNYTTQSSASTANTEMVPNTSNKTSATTKSSSSMNWDLPQIPIP